MYSLTLSQITQYDSDGYVLLKNRLPPELLAMLQSSTEVLEQEVIAQFEANTGSPDYNISLNFFKPFVDRILYFHKHAPIKLLSVLGCPHVMNIAQSLCGDNFISTVDMMVFKRINNSSIIPWHQDMIRTIKRHRVIAIGIYLDDSKVGDGGVRFVKNSQFEKHDMCAMMENEPATEDIFELNIEAGDILVHDPMLVHCSGVTKHQVLRRTLYHEIRPIEQIQEEENWPHHLIERRLELTRMALEQYKKFANREHGFNWKVDPKLLGKEAVRDVATIYQEKMPFCEANYCQQQK